MCVSLRTLCVSTKPKRRAPAGAAKPDSGEATMRKHGAEVLNSGEPNNVSCWRSTRGEDTMRKHGAEVPNVEQAFGERMAGERELRW